jgi:hypothetical protein
MVTQPKDEQLKINAQTQAAAAGRAPRLCSDPKYMGEKFL